jgi:hypothetical protein
MCRCDVTVKCREICRKVFAMAWEVTNIKVIVAQGSQDNGQILLVYIYI